MDNKKFAIAIDGPSGAGKSTIAKLVAKRLGIIYIDTGAMYRAVALAAIRRGIDTKNEAQVIAIIDDVDISIKIDGDGQKVFLGTEDVSQLIRTPEVSEGASNVSAFGKVRTKLVEMQREIAQDADVVMDGRDIGTNVLPNAELKIFLTASTGERARRRFEELKEKGFTQKTIEEVEEEMKQRDYNDSHRAINPLTQAIDAVLIDSTDMTIEEVADAICSYEKF